MDNDHGFSKASPNGNHLIDCSSRKFPALPPEDKICEVCGQHTDILFPVGYIEAGSIVYICQSCKDYEEIMAQDHQGYNPNPD